MMSKPVWWTLSEQALSAAQHFDFAGTCFGCGANSNALNTGKLCQSCAAGNWPDDVPWDSPPPKTDTGDAEREGD